MSRSRPHSNLLPVALAAILLIAAGCAAPPAATESSLPPPPNPTPAQTQPADDPGRSQGPTAPQVSAAATAPTGPHPARALLETYPWAAAILVDVTTGEPFSIASLAGQTVFVETMAIWCSNCRAQQTRFRDALAALGDGVAYVVLTVDPSETAEALAAYKEDRGFVGRYAVAGKEVSRALAEAFGSTVLNPPSVPLIHITPDGEVTFSTGGESVDEIIGLAGA